MYIYIYIYIYMYIGVIQWSLVGSCILLGSPPFSMLSCDRSQAQLSRKTQLPPAESKPNTDDVLFLDAKMPKITPRWLKIQESKVGQGGYCTQTPSFYNVLHIYIYTLYIYTYIYIYTHYIYIHIIYIYTLYIYTHYIYIIHIYIHTHTYITWLEPFGVFFTVVGCAQTWIRYPDVIGNDVRNCGIPLCTYIYIYIIRYILYIHMYMYICIL